jgi:DNA-binding NarL/FixJ family response regulator
MLSENLTERELEVTKYIAQGLTNKEIAKILMVTHHTVKAHVASIIKKLEVRNRIDIAILTQKEGLLSPRQD